MKKIDAYSIDINKALVFVLLSILLTIFSIVVIIVPTMEDYKIAKIENRHAKKKFLLAKKYHNGKLAELKALAKRNRKSIEALEDGFDEKKFTETMSFYLSELKLNFSEEKTHNIYFNERDINVSGIYPNPKNFFDSIRGLNSFKNSLAVDFPITISTGEKGNGLFVSYRLKEYFLKDLNETFSGEGIK